MIPARLFSQHELNMPHLGEYYNVFEPNENDLKQKGQLIRFYSNIKQFLGSTIAERYLLLTQHFDTRHSQEFLS